MKSASLILSEAEDPMVVSFGTDVEVDPGGESLALIRRRRSEALLPTSEAGVRVLTYRASGEPENEDRRGDLLAEVMWSPSGVVIATETGRRFELDLAAADRESIERAVAVLERMNFDKTFEMTGATVTDSARREILMNLLDSDDPSTVRSAIEDAERSPGLLTDFLLDSIEQLEPDPVSTSNIPMLSFYLLASFREPRALEPIVRFYELGGDEADRASGDVVGQDLAQILVSVSGGDLAPIRRLIESKSASIWARGAAVDALVLSAAHELVPYDEVETILAELMNGGLPRDRNHIWSALSCAVADLGSSRLLPAIERAYDEGMIDTTFVTLAEVRADVRRGPETMLAGTRAHHPLVDDVVQATSWWNFFHDKRGRPPAYLPELPVLPIRTGPKTGRNEPCPCQSGKKFKRCCGR